MSFWFKTYREHSDDPQNSMLAEIYRLILQTRSEVTSTDTGSGDLEKKRVEVVPSESYIIIISGQCFTKGEARPVNQRFVYHTGWEPDHVALISMLNFNYRSNVINDRSLVGNNASLKGLPKIVSYTPEYPPSSLKLNGLDAYVDMGNTPNLKIGEASGYSIKLDGSNDYIDLGAQTSLWSKNLSKFTISMWVNATNAFATNYRTFFGCADDPSEDAEISMYFIGPNVDVTPYGAIGCDITNDAYTTANNVVSNFEVGNNTWYHITLTYDNTLTGICLKLYVNAEAQSNGYDYGGNYNGKVLDIDAATKAYIGKYISTDGNEWGGRVKDFRFWGSKALNITEIDDVMNNRDTAPMPDYWLLMTEGSGNPVDRIQSVTATLTGGPTWNADVDYLEQFGSPEITMAYWMYVNTLPSVRSVALATGSMPCAFGYMDSSGRLKFRFIYKDGNRKTIDSQIGETGTWHRVMGSHSRRTGQSKIYVDGALADSQTKNDYLMPSGFGTGNRFTLGARNTTYMHFDGVNDYLNLGNQSDLWSLSQTKWSFSFWFYATDAWGLTYRTLMSHFAGGNGITVFFAQADSAFLWADITQGAQYGAAKFAFTSGMLNQWHFVTVTFDTSLGSNALKIYLNASAGTVTEPGYSPSTYNNSAELWLGEGHQGDIRDFKWWNNKALTLTEIDDTMNIDASAPVPNYWLPLHQGSGDPINVLGKLRTAIRNNGADWGSYQEEYMDGNIKNVKVWKRQLTDDEALADYNGEYVSPVDLVSEWNFDEDEHDDTAFDSQSYNTGYIHNGIFDQSNLPFSLTAPYPYVDGVVNELIGYRMTGNEYMMIPELSDDFRVTPTTGGKSYVFLVKFSQFDMVNGRYMRLFEKADDLSGDAVQVIYIRDDGKLYVELRKYSNFVQKIRTVYPLKLNKLYVIGVGIDLAKLDTSNATGDELDMIKVYLNGFNAPIEVSTLARDGPNDPAITDLHSYIGTVSTDPLEGAYIGQMYWFRAYNDYAYDDTMLALMCNKFTTRAIDRGHVLVSNLSKLKESTMVRATALAGPSGTAIHDVFEYFLTDTVPTARFVTDGVPIDDEFNFTLTTPVHFYSLLLSGTAYVAIPVIDPVKKHFSISVWIKYTGNTGGWGGIIQRIDGMPNGNRLMVTGTKIRWHAKYGDDSDPFVNYEVTVPDMTNAWHHIAMTYDGEDDERLKLFLDGHMYLSKHQEHQIRGGPDEDEGDKTHIGKGADSNYYFHGKIDRLVIYDKTLTDSEVRKLARKETVDTGKMAEFNFERDFKDDADNHDFNGEGRSGADFSTDVP